MIQPRASLESVAHAAAKVALRDWLVAAYSPRSELGAVGLLVAGVRHSYAWKPNRPQAPHGVWLEYPWSPGEPACWDETDQPITLTGDHGAIPSLSDHIALRGAYPAIIFDIAIQSQGRIDAAFEIVWRNDVTDRKRAIIQGSTVTVFTVSADWVIQQTGRPETITCMQRIEAR